MERTRLVPERWSRPTTHAKVSGKERKREEDLERSNEEVGGDGGGEGGGEEEEEKKRERRRRRRRKRREKRRKKKEERRKKKKNQTVKKLLANPGTTVSPRVTRQIHELRSIDVESERRSSVGAAGVNTAV
jgi:hypothetical protein